MVVLRGYLMWQTVKHFFEFNIANRLWIVVKELVSSADWSWHCRFVTWSCPFHSLQTELQPSLQTIDPVIVLFVFHSNRNISSAESILSVRLSFVSFVIEFVTVLFQCLIFPMLVLVPSNLWSFALTQSRPHPWNRQTVFYLQNDSSRLPRNRS